jgi:hypothetical protein
MGLRAHREHSRDGGMIGFWHVRTRSRRFEDRPRSALSNCAVASGRTTFTSIGNSGPRLSAAAFPLRGGLVDHEKRRALRLKASLNVTKRQFVTVAADSQSNRRPFAAGRVRNPASKLLEGDSRALRAGTCVRCACETPASVSAVAR